MYLYVSIDKAAIKLVKASLFISRVCGRSPKETPKQGFFKS